MTLPRAYADASRPIELPLQEWESPLTGGVPAGEQVSAVCPDGKCPYLGQLVYLPSQNAVDAPKGREFLKDLKIGGCVRIYDNDPRSRNEFSEFESMSAFTDHVSTESSIEGSRSSKILSMKASAKLTTNAESSTTNTFKSVVLDITVKKRNIDIEHNDTCLDAVNMTDRFLKGFSALPLIDSKNVTNGGDWKQYVDFLVDQGSHIITRLTTGARYQMWMSSSSKDEEALRKLKASACAEVEGVEAKKEEQNGVSPTGKACAEFDSTSRKKSKELSSKREIIVLGGGKDEFNALNVSRTDNVPPDPEILKAFIASADQGTSPVSFGYKPIWEALKYIYQVGCAENGPDSIDCNNLQRAFTLQAAYDGYVAVGCDYRTAGKYAYQAMAVDDKGSNGINPLQMRRRKDRMPIHR